MPLNTELSDLFRNFAAIMEIRGESPFKAIAFSKVSRILKDMTFDVRQLCEDGKLADVEGLGASSCRIISEYVKTGRSAEFEEAAQSVPAGLLPLLDIPGLGMRRVALRHLTRSRGASPSLDTAIGLIREAAASFSWEASDD